MGSTFKNLKPILHPLNLAVNRDKAVDVFDAPLSFDSDTGHYVFTVNTVTAFPAVGQTYTNNSSTFTVVSTTDAGGGAGTITATRTAGTNAPQASGNLTESGTLGVGDTTIAFTDVTGAVEIAFSDTIPSGAMALVQFYGVAKGDGGSRAVFIISAGVENNSGTYALVGSASKFVGEDDGDTDVAVTVTGNKINLVVTPIGGITTKWKFGYNKLVF